MELATLYVQLAANADAMKQGLDGALGHAKGWAGNMGGIAKMALGGLVVAGAAAAAGAVVAIGAAAWGVASDIQQVSNNMVAQLGMAEDQAESFGSMVADIYGNNFGESIADVGQAVSETYQQFQRLGDVAESEIEGATTAALALRDAFGIEVSESTEAAAVLMQEFGLSSAEAMDFVTYGFQNGLNASDDFLDSITEYGNLFGDLGFDAGMFFSTLETGLEGGVLGTDKIADAWKEFGIKVNEGGDKVSDAFEAIGYDFEEIQASVASGDETWADYAENIVARLEEIDDPIKRNQIQVALFGTMAEDLGVSFTSTLETMSTGLEDMAGATEKLNKQYDNWPSMWEGIKRKTQVALVPLGNKMLEIANHLMPHVERAMGWLETGLPPLIDSASAALGSLTDWISVNVMPVLLTFGAWFTNTAQPAIQEFVDGAIAYALPYLQQFSAWFTDTAMPAVQDFINNAIAVALPYLQQFSAWFAETGGPAIREFVDGALAILIPGFEQLWVWIQQLAVIYWPLLSGAIQAVSSVVIAAATAAWPYLQQAIQYVQEHMEFFRPILIAIGGLILGLISPVLLVAGVIIGFATAWAHNWGGIQEKTAAVWAFLVGVFTAVKTWVVGTLIPTVISLYTSWQENWSTIQTVTQNVWTILVAIFEELDRWINDNIVPWVEFLQEKWDEAFSGAQEATTSAWAVIEPIFNTIKEWLEIGLRAALDGLRSAWESNFLGIRSAVENFKGVWDGFVSAVKSFWEWLKSADFSFDISIPDLPDWAKPPGSGDGAEDAGGGTSGASSAIGGAGFGAEDIVSQGGGAEAAVTNNYNMTVNTNAPTEPIIADFLLMQAAWGS